MSRAVAFHLVIRGRVQGVGYRDSMVYTAEAAGVVGWVRNTRDGDVEALVQGEPDAVERMIKWCRRGPPVARVAHVEIEPVDVEPLILGFMRRPTA